MLPRTRFVAGRHSVRGLCRRARILQWRHCWDGHRTLADEPQKCRQRQRQLLLGDVGQQEGQALLNQPVAAAVHAFAHLLPLKHLRGEEMCADVGIRLRFDVK